MATQNEDLIAETAAVLLEEISKAAKRLTTCQDLRCLAEAFAVVADGDPSIRKTSGRVWTA